MYTPRVMRHYVISCVFYVCFLFLCWPQAEGQDQRCDGNVIYINVTLSGGMLYSPGYPEHYGNGDKCTWVLTSQEVGKVLQLRPLDLQLGLKGRKEGFCGGDVLVAHDGNRTSGGRLLHAWCGRDESAVHSTSASVLLRLTTDHQRRYRGFALKYSLLTLSDNSCDGGVVKTIPLQNNAVVVHFTAPAWTFHKHIPVTCSWRIVADDVSSHVVVDLEKLDPGLPCDEGNFSVYDGPETSSPEVVKWCDHSAKPFSSVYLSGSQGMVVIRTRPNVTSDIRFRFYTRPKFPSECSLSPGSMPSVELKGHLPVFLRFPFDVNASGESCPVRLLSGTSPVLWARVDLVMVDGQPPSCLHDPPPLALLQANETKDKGIGPAVVQSTCPTEGQVVFWPMAEWVILSPSDQARWLVVRVSPAHHSSCHGRVSRLTAPSDDTIVLRNPPSSTRNLHYSSSAWCRYVIGGESETDHVLSRLEGELCEMGEDGCDDFVRIYDGPSTDSPVLYDSDGQNHVSAYVISSGRHVTYEINTDSRANRGFILGEFNSVPEATLCRDVQNIQATRELRNLSSVNYPHYYPVNYMCQYCITSELPDDVIYVQVLDSDMTYSCSDVVEVYDGSFSGGGDYEYLGRFCGQDRPQFSSRQPSLCLLFRSGPSLHGRGWVIAYRAGPPVNASVFVFPQPAMPTSSAAVAVGMATEVVVLAVLLTLVALVLVVVIVVFVVRARRREDSSSL